MKKISPVFSFLAAPFSHLKSIVIPIVFLFISTADAFGQCNSPLLVNTFGGCGNERVLDVSVNDIPWVVSYYMWYQKTSSGTWDYLGQSPSDSGHGTFPVYVTSTTTFGVSYYNDTYGCESSKYEITVSGPASPYVSGSGYSCEYSTAYVQVQGPGISLYELYRYDGTYNLIDSNSTGSFTVSNFNTDNPHTTNYYARGMTADGCWSSDYTQIGIEAVRPAMPAVTGNPDPCYNMSTTLTASGGYEGGYRWYKGPDLISGETGSQFNTGVLTVSAIYYVSTVATTMNGLWTCEGPKRPIVVTVRNPSAPAPLPATRCGPGNVTLITGSPGFVEYQWYDQGNTLLGTTTNPSLSVPSAGLSSYKLKVKDSYGCPSGMSSSATVSITHTSPPIVSQDPGCGPNTQITMHANYYGDRAGNYYIEWYTTAAGGSPEYAAPVSQIAGSATYAPFLPGDTQYWVAIYDPATSYECRTERTPFLATVGSAPYVTGTGYSCEYSTAHIQAQTSPGISTYYLYKYEDAGSGLTYNLIDYNSTGGFTVNNFNSDQAPYISNYYLGARSAQGCMSSTYSRIDIDVMRPAMPTVTGDKDLCYGQSTTLTAGDPRTYRWYEGTDTNLLPGETSQTLQTGSLTSPVTYFVSYIVQGWGGQCESPKATIEIGIIPSSSVTGFSISPGMEFYGSETPTLSLSHSGSVGTVTYESSTNGTSWSAVPGSLSVTQTTQFQAKAVNADCAPTYSSPITVSLYPLPVVTINEGVNYLNYGNALHLSTGTYYSYQWVKDGQDIAGANQRTFNATQPGIYNVRVKGSSTSQQVASESVTIYGDAVQSQNLNYVSTITFLDEGLNSSALYTLSPDQYSKSTAYFDGLGRPMQTVVAKGSPQANDVIQPIVYDEFGREKRKYLPFVNPDRNAGLYIGNGLIINPGNGYDYIGEAALFYDSPETKVANDDRPYAETVFEPSPLNRVIEQGAPGAVWQPGTGKTIKKAYEINGADQVRLWTYTNPGTEHPLGLVESQALYGVNELFKNVTTDEHGNDVIEYVDKEGRTVLKRVQAVDDEPDGDAPPINDTNYASTYYIYDDLGNLVCVMQPEGVRNIAGYFSADDTGREAFLQTWTFRYRYDDRSRMIIKQVPGADSVVMVYDHRDRLILSQDGELRNEHKWLFTKYDALNRPVMTGIYTHGTEIYQRDMADNVSTTLSEVFDGTLSNHGYSNNAFPNANLEFHTVTYYDNYDFRDQLSEFDDNFEFKDNELPGGGLPGQETDYFSRVSAQVTGTKTRVLGTQTWLCAVNYFDNKYRVIQSTSHHYKNGGFNRATNVYDFAGKVLRTKTLYSIPGHPQIAVVQRFSYDHAGRLLNTWHKIGTSSEVLLSSNEYNELGELVTKKLHQTGTPVTADPLADDPATRYDQEIVSSSYSPSQNTYIAPNRIRLLQGFTVPKSSTFRARIGYSEADALAYNNSLGNGFLQTIDYRYNIRGWLKQINDPANPVQDDLFNMALAYNSPSANGGDPQFNGNISEAVWESAGGGKQSYGYDYDPMNRILKGSYYNLANPAQNGWYNEQIGDKTLPANDPNSKAYDLNGNIVNLLRNGKKDEGEYGLMDKLHYGYGNGGNKLLFVSDAEATGAAEKGFTELSTGEGSTDYGYDENGNLTKDENKGLTGNVNAGINGIEYNHLNLPSRVSKSATEYIIYTYDATGRKLAQQVIGTEAKTTEYVGGLVFERDTLRFMQHAEGRAVAEAGAPDHWEYQYHLKDHLGNVRVTFTSKNEVEDPTATMEDANAASEVGKFLYYAEAVKVNTTLFDHSNTGTTYYSTRLNGSENERTGLARSISVMRGDTIKTEVYAKYLDVNSGNWTTALNNLITSIANGTAPPGTLVDGGGAGSTGGTAPSWLGLLNKSNETGTAPKAYLNYLIFDRDYNLLNGGFVRMTEAAREYGQDGSHEKLAAEFVVTQPGYVYIFLSNDNAALGGQQVEVFFDDFKVEHVKSSVVQMDDYYPFGLTFNSYARENSAPQDYKFNGKEEQNELGLGWIDYGLRMYQPDIGRWGVIDPAADKYYSYSPFVYCGNSPTNIVDPNGADWIIERTEKDGKASYNITLNAKVYNNSGKKLDMAALTKQMKSQIESTFSTGNIDSDIEVNTTVNIEAVNSLDDVKDTDHLITIESDQNYEQMAALQGGEGTSNGYADAGGLKVVLPHRTADGILKGDNTRTISHELGHTAGLYHPNARQFSGYIVQGVNKMDKNDTGNNLMYGNPNGGNRIKTAQIKAMYNYYQQGRLNQQTQFNREGHIMFTPALNPQLMYYQTRGGINYTMQKWTDTRDKLSAVFTGSPSN